MFDDTGSKLEVYEHVKFFEAGVRKTTYSVQMEIKHSKCLRRQIFFWHFLVDSCI